MLLPLPPSANALWVVSGNRRVKSAPYRKWLRETRWMVKGKQMPEKTPLYLSIRAGMNRTGDLDNRIKALSDLLQVAGIVPDDRWIDRIDARRDPFMVTGWCEVSVGVIDVVRDAHIHETGVDERVA